jgi:hypothetical protein
MRKDLIKLNLVITLAVLAVFIAYAPWSIAAIHIYPGQGIQSAINDQCCRRWGCDYYSSRDLL